MKSSRSSKLMRLRLRRQCRHAPRPLPHGTKDGFSLIAALIGVAIVGIGFAALSTLMSGANEGAAYQKQNVGWQILRQNISSILQNGKACKKTLTGHSLSQTATAISIKNVAGQVYLALGTTVDGLKVTQIDMRLLEPAPAAGSVQGELVVEVTKVGKKILGAPKLSSTFLMNVQFAGGAVTGCGTANSSFVAVTPVGAVQGGGWSTWIYTDKSPTEICQEAGFSYAPGLCEGVHPVGPGFTGGTTGQGAVLANRGNNGRWGLVCEIGGGTGIYVPPTSVLCAR